MIERPGIYIDMPTAEYFADPCISPSLTQSVAKLLLDRSPLHAWHAHPRLNPDYQHDDDTKFDVGNIAHKLLLGRGKEIARLDHDDWRTKAAKEAREAAAADGKLAVLGKHYARAERMVAAAREQLALRQLDYLFSDGGDSEVCMAWQEGDLWLRQLVDWLSRRAGGAIVADYKTTDMSVAPHGLGRMMVNAGWPIQAAMSDRGLTALFGSEPCDFVFVVQESQTPYALNVVALSADALTMGRKQLDHAVKRWGECIAADRWPGYPLEIVTPEYPGWHEQQWLDREIHDAAQQRMPRREPMLTDLSGG